MSILMRLRHGQRGWCQIKMIFDWDDHQALQTLLGNNTISAEAQFTSSPSPWCNTIESSKKDHPFLALSWHEILSHLHQLPDEGIHSLNTCINTLVQISQKFTIKETWETIKLMFLQHAIKYHEARNWICLPESKHPDLTMSPEAHCKQFEQCCEAVAASQSSGE